MSPNHSQVPSSQPSGATQKLPPTLRSVPVAQIEPLYQRMRNYVIASNCVIHKEVPPPFQQVSLDRIEPLYQHMRDAIIAHRYHNLQMENQRLKEQLLAEQEQLQSMMSQLVAEKNQLAAQNRQTVAALHQEVETMGQHLDTLTDAFDKVDSGSQGQWNFMAMASPFRLREFRQAVYNIVTWWQSSSDEDNDDKLGGPSLGSGPNPLPSDDDRRDRPQLHSDPASLGRSLLDR